VIDVLTNSGFCVRLYAVLRPKTPEPRIKTDLGTSWEGAAIISLVPSLSGWRIYGKVEVEDSDKDWGRR
jgi:hypothetical protein